jgi:hypothetical protein
MNYEMAKYHILRILPEFGLVDTPPNYNGIVGGRLVSPTQATFMFHISWFCFLSGIYALYRKYYDIAFAIFVIWATSLHYWSNPTNHAFRILDIIVVWSIFVYMLFRAYHAKVHPIYYVVYFMAVSCYWISWTVQPFSQWLATLIHAVLHVLATLSNFILCSHHLPIWI